MADLDLKGPDFIGIGMERAGTSWLFTQLAAHPQIWVPPLKEIHFFDVIDPQAKYLTHRYSYHLKSRIKQKFYPLLGMQNRPEFRKNSYGMGFIWDYYYFTGAFDVGWYKRLFHPKFTQGRVCGEITPAYSNLTAETIQKIIVMNPQVRFLLIVRNPVQRLWSGVIHYFSHVKKQNFTHVDEHQIIEYLKNSAAFKRSDLQQILMTWQNAVPKEKILIQDFDEIQQDPEKIIRNSYNFLGVDTDFMPPAEFYQGKINAYSKEEYSIPASVKTLIQERIEPSLAALSQTHPEIVQRWMKKS